MMKSIEIERVVLGDRRLVGDLEELLAQVDPDGPVGDRVDEDQTRASDPDRPAQPEEHDPLVLPDDLDRPPERDEQDQDNDPDDDAYDHVLPPSRSRSWVTVGGRASGSSTPDLEVQGGRVGPAPEYPRVRSR